MNFEQQRPHDHGAGLQVITANLDTYITEVWPTPLPVAKARFMTTQLVQGVKHRRKLQNSADAICCLWQPPVCNWPGQRRNMHKRQLSGDPCRDVSNLVIAGQGPPPPNPAVVERFQQVISQLFQQVGQSFCIIAAQFTSSAVDSNRPERLLFCCVSTLHVSKISMPLYVVCCSELCEWEGRWMMTWPILLWHSCCTWTPPPTRTSSCM